MSKAGDKHKYLAFPPVAFNRLDGPWTSHMNAPSIVDVSRERQGHLRKLGVSRWYRQTTGSTLPSPKNRHRVFPFGAPDLKLTSTEATAFRREFPDLTLIRNAPIRMALQPPAAASAATPNLWHLGTTGVNDARAAGWATHGEGVTVAIVDCGIDSSHTEFDGKFILSTSYDAQGNNTGPVQAVNRPHGTHVAALVAGRTVGLAPAASIVDVQAFLDGATTPSQLSAALFFAAASNARIINLSGGFPTNQPFLESAVAQILAAGKLLVCATGNTANVVTCPANFDSPLSVGAVDPNFQVPADSGSGSISTPSGIMALPEVVAPGVDVFSAVPGGGFGLLTGTSQAAAVVSGMAVLRISDRQGNLSLADLIAQVLTHTRSASPASRAGNGSVFYNRIPA